MLSLLGFDLGSSPEEYLQFSKQPNSKDISAHPSNRLIVLHWQFLLLKCTNQHQSQSYSKHQLRLSEERICLHQLIRLPVVQQKVVDNTVDDDGEELNKGNRTKEDQRDGYEKLLHKVNDFKCSSFKRVLFVYLIDTTVLLLELFVFEISVFYEEINFNWEVDDIK